MSSSRPPSSPGTRSLTRARRASQPSTESMAIDTASQRNASRDRPPTVASSASHASTAPEAVSKWTSQATAGQYKRGSTRNSECGLRNAESAADCRPQTEDQTAGVSMQYRPLGRTGWNVSTISFGAWAIGGAWGPVDEADAIDALHAALDLGINFFDTADVYGDGASERLLARLRRERTDDFHVATKAGRRLDPHTADGYTYANLARFVERSLVNL